MTLRNIHTQQHTSLQASFKSFSLCDFSCALMSNGILTPERIQKTSNNNNNKLRKQNKKPNLAQWVSEFIEVTYRSLGDSKVEASANSQAQNG